MSNLTAKFAPVLLAGVAASAVVVALPVRAAHAADSCLTEPKGDAPHGKHWHYRIERGTGHHCWYIRGEDEKSADAPSAAPTEQVASQQPDATASRSFADAHDEVAPRASTPDNAANAAPAPAAPSVWPNAPAAATAAPSDPAAAAPTPTPDASPSPVASRWPQPTGTAPTAAPQQPAAASQQDDVSAMVANAEPNTTAEPASEPASTAPAPPADLAAAPVERQTGSLQKLLLVAFSALALAGFTGSAVYRLGRRRNRRNDWLRERTSWQDAPNPHRPPWVDEPRIQPDLAVADLRHDLDHDLDHEEADLDQPHEAEPQSGFSLAANETAPGSERIEKIEEFLARLTQQLHDELDGTRPHSA